MNEKNIKRDLNIELSGFRSIDPSTMSVLKKEIENHTRRIQELTKNPERLHITLKSVHEREKSEKYEVHAKLIDNGKLYVAETTERNILVAVDSVLKKLVNELD